MNTDEPNSANEGQSRLTVELEKRVSDLEYMLRTLLIAAMPIRADDATIHQISKAIPDLYDACHSASILLWRSNSRR